MTYLQFLLIFLVPPIVILAGVKRFREESGGSGRPYVQMGLIAAIALVYTTPWDNYLIAIGVWAYSPNVVIGTIGLVPVEEYCFFILQPFATGLLFEALRSHSEVRILLSREASLIGVVIGTLLTVVGIVAHVTGFSIYLGLILIWSGPVLILQWAFNGGLLRRSVKEWFIPLAFSTIYFWIADAIAIQSGIWSISASATVGWKIGGLPIEEMTFFLVTNAMVLFGLVLLQGSRPGRLAEATK